MIRHAMLLGSAVAATSLVIAGVGCSQKVSSAESASSDVTGTPVLPVISQVYAGGAGDLGAYVEIFNPSASPVAVGAYDLQWAAGTADFSEQNVLPLPTDGLTEGRLAPGQHLYVKLPAGAPITAAAGKVAIVSNAAHASGCVADAGAASCAKANTIDYFGWGTNTFVPQPGAPATALTAETAAIRLANGCQNLGDNSKDFTSGAPAPHAIDDAPTPCAQPDAGATDAGPATKDGGDAAAPSLPFILINELKMRGGAAGTSGFVELACTAGMPLKTFVFASIDAQGVATNVVDLAPYSCGKSGPTHKNGYVLLAAEGGVQPIDDTATVIRLPKDQGIKDPSATYFLLWKLGAEAPVVGTSYDPSASGKLTWPAAVYSYDSIAAKPDTGTHRYADAVVTADPDALSRPFSTGIIPIWNKAVQWFGGGLVKGDDALLYETAKATDNIPQDVFALTPGGPNIAPEVDAGTPTSTGTTADGGAGASGASGAAASKKTAAGDEPLADSAPSVCSMTSGPRGPGYGFLAGLGLALGAIVARRRRR